MEWKLYSKYIRNLSDKLKVGLPAMLVQPQSHDDFTTWRSLFHQAQKKSFWYTCAHSQGHGHSKTKFNKWIGLTTAMMYKHGLYSMCSCMFPRVCFCPYVLDWSHMACWKDLGLVQSWPVAWFFLFNVVLAIINDKPSPSHHHVYIFSWAVCSMFTIPSHGWWHCYSHIVHLDGAEDDDNQVSVDGKKQVPCSTSSSKVSSPV